MRYPERREENAVDLESQFIMRMPPEPARIIREMIRSGVSNFKDRVSIRLENDIRYGEVRVDHYLLHAKVVDLPTVMESLKTIDNKSFYKTADICQLLICKEEEDQATTDDETPSKIKKKDPNKVDKKFLWPHGFTPPMKNVRRRRFRKTLKKKFVEQPEIEKEVKRLLRSDNDAVNVKWEVITDEEEKHLSAPASHAKNIRGAGFKKEKKEKVTVKSETGTASSSVDVAEREIFGSAVSDSDEENINVLDIDENSRLSGEDSRLYDSDSHGRGGSSMMKHENTEELITEFSKDMFGKGLSAVKSENIIEIKNEPIASTSYEYDMYKQQNLLEDDLLLKSEGSNIAEYTGLSRDQIMYRMSQLQSQIADLRSRQEQQEIKLTSIENQALRQRFQEILDQLNQEMYEKEIELQQLQELL